MAGQDHETENGWDDSYAEALPDIRFWLEQLGSVDPQIRQDAVQALWDYVEEEALGRLLDLAESDPEQAVRCKAISGLGRYMWEADIIDFEWDDPYRDDWFTQEHFERAHQFLLGVWQDSGRSFDERRYAVEALSFLHNDGVTSLIEELYARPEKEAKISGIFAMGRNGSERWLDIIGREIWSRDKDIRLEALEAAGEMNAESLGKDLLRMTYDHDGDVVKTAIWALGQTGWEEAFDRLDELALHPDPEIRELADAAMDEWMLFNQMAEDLDEEEEGEGDDESSWML